MTPAPRYKVYFDYKLVFLTTSLTSYPTIEGYRYLYISLCSPFLPC